MKSKPIIPKGLLIIEIILFILAKAIQGISGIVGKIPFLGSLIKGFIGTICGFLYKPLLILIIIIIVLRLLRRHGEKKKLQLSHERIVQNDLVTDSGITQSNTSKRMDAF